LFLIFEISLISPSFLLQFFLSFSQALIHTPLVIWILLFTIMPFDEFFYFILFIFYFVELILIFSVGSFCSLFVFPQTRSPLISPLFFSPSYSAHHHHHFASPFSQHFILFCFIFIYLFFQFPNFGISSFFLNLKKFFNPQALIALLLSNLIFLILFCCFLFFISFYFIFSGWVLFFLSFFFFPSENSPNPKSPLFNRTWHTLGYFIKELTETVNKSESFAEFGSWIEAARDLVCAYLHNNDVDDNHTAKAQGQQEIIPFPQTWSELVAEDNYERSVARRERRHPQSLKPAFLSAVPGVLGLSQEQWGLIEQFYSDRCDCFHRKKTPTETACRLHQPQTPPWNHNRLVLIMWHKA